MPHIPSYAPYLLLETCCAEEYSSRDRAVQVPGVMQARPVFVWTSVGGHMIIWSSMSVRFSRCRSRGTLCATECECVGDMISVLFCCVASSHFYHMDHNNWFRKIPERTSILRMLHTAPQVPRHQVPRVLESIRHIAAVC